MSLLLSLLVAALPIAAPSLTKEEATQLDARVVLVRPLTPADGTGISVQAVGVIDAPTREVWPVVRDCQHFGAFMPRTRAASLVELDGRPLCHGEVALPFPLRDLWSDSSTEDVEGPVGHFRRSLTMVRGTYERNDASWTVVPWRTGQSLVIYFVDTKPKLPIPEVIVRAMQGDSFPDVFAAIRRRVASLRTQAK